MQEPYEDESEEQAPPDVVALLVSMEVDELRAFAEAHGVDISGLEEKPDLVDAISLHPGIARILVEDGPEEGEAPSEKAKAEEAPEDLAMPEEASPEGGEGEDVPEELPEADEPTRQGVQDLPERLQAAMGLRVDFSALEHHLSEAATKFSERNYDAAAQTARNSVLLVEDVVKDYVDANWAFAIASMQRMLEETPDGFGVGEETQARLEEAIQVYRDDASVRPLDVLERLVEAALDLHANQMDAARDHVASQGEVLKAIQGMGGDTTRARAMLGKATQALKANQRAAYADLIGEADRLVAEAREARVGELSEKREAVSTLVEEAATIGADVGRASSLLEDARQAFDTEDFGVVHDLLGRAEKAALDAQKDQIDRVSAMREQQLGRVKDLIAEVKPAIDRARGEGFQAKEALGDLKAAAQHAEGGDYVNALMKAKRAYNAVKAFHSELEAKRIEEETPLPAEPPKEPAAPTAPSEGPSPPGEPSDEGSGAVPPEESPSEASPEPRFPPPPEPICIYCGSADLHIKKNGKARCRECKRKFRL